MNLDLPGQSRISIPEHLTRNLLDLHKDRTRPWFSHLPGLLADVLKNFEATLAPELPDLSYHLVLFADSTRHGHIVVKCTVPNEEYTPSSHGAVLLADAGGPKVWRNDPVRGVIVMERILPGESLSATRLADRDDAGATRILATQATAIHRHASVSAAAAHLPGIRQWIKALDDVSQHHPMWHSQQGLIQHARTLRDQLLATPCPPVLLHGDLHHGNVLRDGDGRWRPIDPHGVIGPAEFDVGQQLLNPKNIEQAPDLQHRLRQRLITWSDVTESDINLLRDWGVVNAVLSACWTADDHDSGWEPAMLIAGMLENLSLN